MKILSVKKSGNGFLINDTISVTNDDPNNKYVKAINEWLADGGSIDLEFSLTELRREKIDQLRAFTKAKITATYPEYKQRNFLAGEAAIRDKRIESLEKNTVYELSSDEEKMVSEAKKCEKWISAIRTKSNQIRRRISTMKYPELETFNPFDDSLWN